MEKSESGIKFRIKKMRDELIGRRKVEKSRKKKGDRKRSKVQGQENKRRVNNRKDRSRREKRKERGKKIKGGGSEK